MKRTPLPAHPPVASAADFEAQLAPRSATNLERVRALLQMGASEGRWSAITLGVGAQLLAEGLPCCEPHLAEVLDDINEETQRARWLVSHYDTKGERRLSAKETT